MNSLPVEGGILDQDPYHVEAMKLVLEAQAERYELDRKMEERKARRG
jgi:hypothetical protein